MYTRSEPATELCRQRCMRPTQVPAWRARQLRTLQRDPGLDRGAATDARGRQGDADGAVQTAHMVHSHTVLLPPGALPSWRTMRGTGCLALTPSLAALAAQVPYQLAYGERGKMPNIPGKACLVFKIELLGVE